MNKDEEQAPCVWLTGLSGAGKSTLAFSLWQELKNREQTAYILDGDAIRKGLCKDLGFSLADREENLRRICEVAKILSTAHVIPIVACISPLEKDRTMARKTFASGKFLLVYVNTPLEECERRDVKGLYAKARKGEIVDFTGIGSPYEIPILVEYVCNCTNDLSSSTSKIINLLGL